MQHWFHPRTVVSLHYFRSSRAPASRDFVVWATCLAQQLCGDSCRSSPSIVFCGDRAANLHLPQNVRIPLVVDTGVEQSSDRRYSYVQSSSDSHLCLYSHIVHWLVGVLLVLTTKITLLFLSQNPPPPAHHNSVTRSIPDHTHTLDALIASYGRLRRYGRVLEFPDASPGAARGRGRGRLRRHQRGARASQGQGQLHAHQPT